MNSSCTFFNLQNSKSFVWPDVALPVVVALEKALYHMFSSDYQKYKQKLRQLVFNLKVGCYFFHKDCKCFLVLSLSFEWG